MDRYYVHTNINIILHNKYNRIENYLSYNTCIYIYDMIWYTWYDMI